MNNTQISESVYDQSATLYDIIQENAREYVSSVIQSSPTPYELISDINESFEEFISESSDFFQVGLDDTLISSLKEELGIAQDEEIETEELFQKVEDIIKESVEKVYEREGYKYLIEELEESLEKEFDAVMLPYKNSDNDIERLAATDINDFFTDESAGAFYSNLFSFLVETEGGQDTQEIDEYIEGIQDYSDRLSLDDERQENKLTEEEDKEYKKYISVIVYEIAKLYFDN